MKLKSLGILGLLLFLAVLMAVTTSDPWYDIFNGTFLKPNNVENLLRRTSMFGLLGIGVAFVIITGGIDLSIGSIVCLSGCLLAMFLRVDYVAVDPLEVIQIRAQDQQLLVRESVQDLEKGDRLWLFGARRARSTQLVVDDVEVVDLEDGEGKTLGKGMRLKVQGDMGRDDDSGQLAPVFQIRSIQGATNGGSPSITVHGTVPELKPRDQVTFVHPTQGQKQNEVVSVSREADQAIIELKRDLGVDFSDQWGMVPKRREQRMSIVMALASVLGIAALLGWIHGLLVTRVRLQPFVVTLCGLLIYRGASRWLVNDQPVGFGNEYLDSLSPLGSGKFVLFSWERGGHTETFGLPYPLFIMVGLALAAAIFLNMTIWGRYLLALGRNEEAARYSGIRTAGIITIAYVICTLAAAIGGMMFALDSNSVSPSSFGNFFELYAIAAAVLGGCSLRGGEGTIFGVIVGTAVMQILNNLILLMRISDELEFAIIGMVILIGVMSDEFIRRIAARRRLRSQVAS